MVRLPSSPKRAHLISFWLSISLLSSLLIGVAAAWRKKSLNWLGLGVVLSFVFTVPGILFYSVIVKFYNMWNGAASFFARNARKWIMGACFYIIFAAVGRAGASLEIRRPNASESHWIPRKTLAPTDFVHPDSLVTRKPMSAGWISNFISWAAQSNNLWACCLLPFFLLLRMLEVEQESDFPGNIYTLY